MKRAALLLFVLAGGAFYWSGSLLGPLTEGGDDVLLGADTAKGARALEQPSLTGLGRKHLLFPLLAGSVAAGFRALPGVTAGRAMTLTTALLAALDLLLIFLILALITGQVPLSFVLSATHGLCYSNLVFFSIPDTYGLTDLVIAGCFLVLALWQGAMNGKRMLTLGFLVGVAALQNPPLLTLLVPLFWVAFRNRGAAFACRFTLAAGLLAGGLLAGVSLLAQGPRFYLFWRGLDRLYGNPGHLVDGLSLLHVAASFFLFGVVAPFSGLPPEGRLPGLADVGAYGENLPGLLALAAYALALVPLVGRLGRPRPPLVEAAILWLLPLVLFYTYYDPKEAIIFSSQALGPLTVVLGWALGRLESRWKWPGLVLFMLLLAAANLQLFRGGGRL